MPATLAECDASPFNFSNRYTATARYNDKVAKVEMHFACDGSDFACVCTTLPYTMLEFYQNSLIGFMATEVVLYTPGQDGVWAEPANAFAMTMFFKVQPDATRIILRPTAEMTQTKPTTMTHTSNEASRVCGQLFSFNSGEIYRAIIATPEHAPTMFDPHLLLFDRGQEASELASVTWDIVFRCFRATVTCGYSVTVDFNVQDAEVYMRPYSSRAIVLHAGIDDLQFTLTIQASGSAMLKTGRGSENEAEQATWSLHRCIYTPHVNALFETLIGLVEENMCMFPGSYLHHRLTMPQRLPILKLARTPSSPIIDAMSLSFLLCEVSRAYDDPTYIVGSTSYAQLVGHDNIVPKGPKRAADIARVFAPLCMLDKGVRVAWKGCFSRHLCTDTGEQSIHEQYMAYMHAPFIKDASLRCIGDLLVIASNVASNVANEPHDSECSKERIAYVRFAQSVVVAVVQYLQWACVGIQHRALLGAHRHKATEGDVVVYSKVFGSLSFSEDKETLIVAFADYVAGKVRNYISHLHQIVRKCRADYSPLLQPLLQLSQEMRRVLQPHHHEKILNAWLVAMPAFHASFFIVPEERPRPTTSFRAGGASTYQYFRRSNTFDASWPASRGHSLGGLLQKLGVQCLAMALQMHGYVKRLQADNLIDKFDIQSINDSIVAFFDERSLHRALLTACEALDDALSGVQRTETLEIMIREASVKVKPVSLEYVATKQVYASNPEFRDSFGEDCCFTVMKDGKMFIMKNIEIAQMQEHSLATELTWHRLDSLASANSDPFINATQESFYMTSELTCLELLEIPTQKEKKKRCRQKTKKRQVQKCNAGADGRLNMETLPRVQQSPPIPTAEEKDPCVEAIAEYEAKCASAEEESFRQAEENAMRLAIAESLLMLSQSSKVVQQDPFFDGEHMMKIQELNRICAPLNSSCIGKVPDLFYQSRTELCG